MSGAWSNVKVEHEKVVDKNPETWFNAAVEAGKQKNYSDALQKTKQGRKFSQGNESYEFKFDVLDIGIYYDCYRNMENSDSLLRARTLVKKYDQEKWRSVFISDPETLNEFWHIDWKTWQNVWQALVKEWFSQENYDIIATYRKDINPKWLVENLDDVKLHNIIKDDELRILQLLEDGGFFSKSYHDSNGMNLTMLSVGGYKNYDEQSENVYSEKIFHHVLSNKYNHINETDYKGYSALDYAVMTKNISAVQEIVNAGADVNSVNPNTRETPLLIACSNIDVQDEEIIKLLISAGADVFVKENSHQYTLLELIAKRYTYGKLAVVQKNIIDMLCAHGVDVNAYDAYNQDAIYLAMRAQNGNVIEALITNGANINRCYESGRTLLHIIARGHHWKQKRIWRTLLDHHANVNARDDKGWTPLMYSLDHNWTFSDELDMARALVRAGAKTDIKANDGTTVWDIMSKHNIERNKLYNNSSSNFFTKLFS